MSPRSAEPPGVEGALPEEADALFEVAPSEFVAARNALAKRLRAAKRREEATAVGAMRRPTASAWALDLVARHDPELVRQALDAGDRLRAATEEAMAGDASRVREATVDERAAAEALVEAAAERAGGATETDRERMAATIRAAILDDDVRDQLVRGVLAQDHVQVGIGFGGGPAAATRTTARPATRPALRVVPPLEGDERSSDDDAGRTGTGSARPRKATGRRASTRTHAAKAEVAQEEQPDEDAPARAAAERARRKRQVDLDRRARTARDRAKRFAAQAERAEEQAARLRTVADEAEAEARAAEVEAAANMATES